MDSLVYNKKKDDTTQTAQQNFITVMQQTGGNPVDPNASSALGNQANRDAIRNEISALGASCLPGSCHRPIHPRLRERFPAILPLCRTFLRRSAPMANPYWRISRAVRNRLFRCRRSSATCGCAVAARSFTSRFTVAGSAAGPTAAAEWPTDFGLRPPQPDSDHAASRRFAGFGCSAGIWSRWFERSGCDHHHRRRDQCNNRGRDDREPGRHADRRGRHRRHRQ